MKNQKGFLLAEETLKIILAVIALTVLAYLLFSVYQTNKNSKDLDLAKESLNFLLIEMGEGSETVDIYNPKGWVISSWPKGSLMPLSCSNLGWESCVCICNKRVWHVPFQLFEKDRLDECNSAGACLENSEKYEIINPIDIKNPPIKLNIDYENKTIF